MAKSKDTPPGNGNGTHRHIAPRLASGLRRVTQSGGLPPHVKAALQMVATARGESLSWVMEQLVYQHFRIRQPAYVGTRKALDIAPTTNTTAIARAQSRAAADADQE